MTTQYSPLLGLALPVTGELSGTWCDVVNDSITSLVEASIAGFATADVTSGNWTLTTMVWGCKSSSHDDTATYGKSWCTQKYYCA
jgi:hypothetical protein